MKILLPHVSAFSRNLLDFFAAHSIDSVAALEPWIGERVVLSAITRPITDMIDIQRRPSNAHTLATVVDYVHSTVGITVSLVFNSSLQYAQLIAKAQDSIPALEPFVGFSSDCFGNRYQYAPLSVDFPSTHAQLERLSRLAVR